MVISWQDETDQELVRLAQRGNDEALIGLWERRRALLAELVEDWLSVRGEGDRDRLMQESACAFFLAVRHYSALEGELWGVADSLPSWEDFLARCVVACLNKVTRESGALEQASDFAEEVTEEAAEAGESGEGAGEESDEDDWDEGHLSAATRERLRKELSPFEAQVFNRYLEGQSYVEIAAVLKRQVKSVDNALYRIKSKLNKALGAKPAKEASTKQA